MVGCQRQLFWAQVVGIQVVPWWGAEEGWRGRETLMMAPSDTTTGTNSSHYSNTVPST